MCGRVSDDTYYEADVFGEDEPQRLKELQDWLKALPCSKVGKVQCGQKNLSENAVKLIEEDLVTMAVSVKSLCSDYFCGFLSTLH